MEVKIFFALSQALLIFCVASGQQQTVRRRTFSAVKNEDTSSSRVTIASFRSPSELACSQKCLRHERCKFKIYNPNEQKCDLLASIEQKDLGKDAKPTKKENFADKENYICKMTPTQGCGKNCKCSQVFLKSYGAEYICDCTERGVFNSCNTALNHNTGQRGIYRLLVSAEIVEVECMKEGGDSLAVFHHDSESKTLVVGYEKSGSYKKSIKYELSISTIIHFINQSRYCKQHTRAQCQHVVIQDYCWLNGRGGEKLSFWGGGPSNGTGCACGITNTCAKTTKKCNCDKNDNVWRLDEGFVTKKEVLPITEVAVGDTGDNFPEYFLFTIGPLFCEDSGFATP